MSASSCWYYSWIVSLAGVSIVATTSTSRIAASHSLETRSAFVSPTDVQMLAAPEVSPDGQYVLITDQQPPKILKRVRLDGGQVNAITNAGNVGASWGPNDDIAVGSHEGALRLVSPGGETRVLTSLDDGEQGIGCLGFCPTVAFFFTSRRVIAAPERWVCTIFRRGSDERWCQVLMQVLPAAGT